MAKKTPEYICKFCYSSRDLACPRCDYANLFQGDASGCIKFMDEQMSLVVNKFVDQQDTIRDQAERIQRLLRMGGAPEKSDTPQS